MQPNQPRADAILATVVAALVVAKRAESKADRHQDMTELLGSIAESAQLQLDRLELLVRDKSAAIESRVQTMFDAIVPGISEQQAKELIAEMAPPSAQPAPPAHQIQRHLNSIWLRFEDHRTESGWGDWIKVPRFNGMNPPTPTTASLGGLPNELAVRVVSADTSVTIDDDIVVATDALTIHLPDASDEAAHGNKIFRLKRSSQQNVTIQAMSGQTIDGETAWVINTNYDSMDVHTDGANWVRL